MSEQIVTEEQAARYEREIGFMQIGADSEMLAALLSTRVVLLDALEGFASEKLNAAYVRDPYVKLAVDAARDLLTKSGRG